MPVAQTLHLFIDTNVLLSFYATSNDNIEELKKIASLISTKALKVYMTQQVRHEFLRNREVKLATSLGDLKKPIPKPSIPRFMVEYPEVATLLKAIADADKARAEAVKRATSEADSGSIAADELVASIIEAAGIAKTTTKLMAAAQTRMALGNPPGKGGSLGDSLNWEYLLSAVPDGEDLHIISKDGDYASPLNKERPHQFLFEEWKAKKKATVFLHPELRPFLQSKFPQIKFAKDVEKKISINRLVNSTSFSSTHQAIADLKPLIDVLDRGEIQEIINSASINTQIYSIGTDTDVQDFFAQLALPRWDELSSTEKFMLQNFFGIDSHEDDYKPAEPDPLVFAGSELDDALHRVEEALSSAKDEDDDIPF